MNQHAKRFGLSALSVAASAFVVAGALVTVPTSAQAEDEPDSTVSGASLDWGVKTSFRNYINGPIADGEITTLGTTTENDDGTFHWSDGSGEAASDGSSADVSFSDDSGVHFLGHKGIDKDNPDASALDIRLTNPHIVVTAQDKAELRADVKSREFIDTTTVSDDFFDEKDVAVADVELPKPTEDDGTLTWQDAPTTLTESGAEAFGGFYETGEGFDPVSFSLPTAEKSAEAQPEITVEPSEDLDPSVDNTLTVTGTGYVGDGAANGVYVLVGEKDNWHGDAPLPADGWVAQEWVQAGAITDGEFTTEVTVPKDSLDADADYQVATSAAHALSQTDRTLDAFANLTVKAPADDPSDPEDPADPEDPEDPDAPAADPKVSVEPNKNLDPGVDNTLTVQGTGYVGDGAKNGVYVLFGEKSLWSGKTALPGDGWIAMEHVQPGDLNDGAFTKELAVPSGTLDSSKQYHVATSAAHALSATDRSLDAFANVTVAQSADDDDSDDQTDDADESAGSSQTADSGNDGADADNAGSIVNAESPRAANDSGAADADPHSLAKTGSNTELGLPLAGLALLLGATVLVFARRKSAQNN
jgi:LPXTG-motif cell wall-anchored protein